MAAACHQAADSANAVRQGDDCARNVRYGEKVMDIFLLLEQKRAQTKVNDQKDQHTAHKSTVKGGTRAPKVHEPCLGVGGKCCVPVIKGLHQGSGIIAAADGKQRCDQREILNFCLKMLSVRKHAVQHKTDQNGDHQANIIQPQPQISAQIYD